MSPGGKSAFPLQSGEVAGQPFGADFHAEPPADRWIPRFPRTAANFRGNEEWGTGMKEKTLVITGMGGGHAGRHRGNRLLECADRRPLRCWPDHAL